MQRGLLRLAAGHLLGLGSLFLFSCTGGGLSPATVGHQEETLVEGPANPPVLLSTPGRLDFLKQQETAVFESILSGARAHLDEDVLGERELLERPRMVISPGNPSQHTCIVSHSTLAMASYAEISARNQREYASLHGYHHINFLGPWIDRRYMDPLADATKNGVHRYGLFWQKIVALQQALQLPNSDNESLCDWVMWMDADAMFTDMSPTLEQVIAPWSGTHDVIVPRQEAWPNDVVINAGVFALRNTEIGRAFVDGVLDLASVYHGRSRWGDQDAMHHYVFQTDFSEVKSLSEAELARRTRPEIAVVEARHFNALYPHSGATADQPGFWSPGLFVAHFSGMGTVARHQAMTSVLCELARRGDKDPTAAALTFQVLEDGLAQLP